jgi:hypothetical protein
MNRNESGSQYVAAWRRNNGVSKWLQRASKMAKTIESNLAQRRNSDIIGVKMSQAASAVSARNINE